MQKRTRDPDRVSDIVDMALMISSARAAAPMTLLAASHFSSVTIPRYLRLPRSSNDDPGSHDIGEPCSSPKG